MKVFKKEHEQKEEEKEEFGKDYNIPSTKIIEKQAIFEEHKDEDDLQIYDSENSDENDQKKSY